jgi:hypothetical protein
MRGEPEAVPVEYQRQLTQRSHLGAEARRRRDVGSIRARLAADLADLATATGPEVAAEVRVLQRGLARLDRKLA